MTDYEFSRLSLLKEQNIDHPVKTKIVDKFFQTDPKDNSIYQKCIVGKDLIKEFPHLFGLKHVFIKTYKNFCFANEYNIHREIFNKCKSHHLPLCLGYKKDMIIYEWVEGYDLAKRYEKALKLPLLEKIKEYNEIIFSLDEIITFLKFFNKQGYCHNDLKIRHHCIFTNCERKFVLIDFGDATKVEKAYIKQEWMIAFFYKRILLKQLTFLRRRLPATSQD